MAEELRKFTVEELKEFNGENGKPVYIAYKGRVIDVTGSKMWRGGSHMKRHSAGADLTAEIAQAPHGIDVLDRYPQVGTLIRDTEEQPRTEAMPGALPAPLERWPLPAPLPTRCSPCRNTLRLRTSGSYSRDFS